MTNEPVSVKMKDRQRELLDGSERIDYKQLDGEQSLSLHVFSPQQAGGNSPAIVFFPGGGLWQHGDLSQFGPQCLHFVKRGMVAMLVDYRLGQRRGKSPMDGVEDARDAVNWICGHAARLGIDPAKVVLAGAASGAFAPLLAVMDSATELRHRPAAMVLFSAIVNVARDGVRDRFGDKRAAKQRSPLHLVRKGLPPMMLFHGGDDVVQAAGEVATFAKKLAKKKNLCELTVFSGERSAFFNFNVNGGLYETTLNMADDFLVRLGLLEGGRDGAATTRLDSWR